MEQNDNQQQENITFKKEDAFQTLSLINTWIGNIDTKISFALAKDYASIKIIGVKW